MNTDGPPPAKVPRPHAVHKPVFPDRSGQTRLSHQKPAREVVPKPELSQMPPRLPSPIQFSEAQSIDFYKKIEGFQFPFCDDVNKKYTKLATIGKGTFGEVSKARVNGAPTEELVAMKRIIMEKETEGFPITALREIKILKLLKHQNIVRLREVCRQTPNARNRYMPSIFLIFEFCHHDLAGLLSSTAVVITEPQIKGILRQLFEGLNYLHLCKILHRDMKSANIFISKDGMLKLGDFGLARAYSVPRDGKTNRYTNRVVTMWYRPPELLLGERNYTPAIDMWGAGCIMAELYTRTPILQGSSETEQIHKILKLCGSIDVNDWPGVVDLELYNKLELPKNWERTVQKRMSRYIRNLQGLRLLDALFALDPCKRLTAEAAADHPYIWSAPPKEDNLLSLVRNTNSCFEATARRAMDQRATTGAAFIHNQASKPRPPVSTGSVVDRVY